MQNYKIILIILYLLSYYCKANIWDNIFGNIDGPKIAFPANFEATFSLK